jgi:anthranilate phosphoribosyltransferase
MDEISLGDATMVGELRAGSVREYEIRPEEFGLTVAPVERLRVENAQESKTMVLQALGNEDGAARDIVLLNSGAALYVADLADSIDAGIAKARDAVASGAARAKLDQFVAATRRLSGR